MRVSDIPGIARLSAAEKLLLVEELWDSIASDESGIPVPESHKAELDKRYTKFKSEPGNLLTLEELQDRIGRRK
jgi:putative addiction module component (TIGR02574 family)